jgi:hypothetical protein
MLDFERTGNSPPPNKTSDTFESTDIE